MNHPTSVESNEVRDFYTHHNRTAAHAPPISSTQPLPIDLVPKEIVAAVDGRGVWSEAPPFLKPILAVFLSDEMLQRTNSVDPVLPHAFVDEETRTRRSEQKKISQVSSVLPNAVGRAIRELMEKSGLYVPARPKPENRDDWEFSSAFFVPKTNGKLRIICDARRFNVRLDTKKWPFTLFSLDELINVISALAREDGTWHAVLTDLRHWFHQLGLQERYRPFFRTDTNFPHDRPDERVVTPRAIPMGWQYAPPIAQAVILVLLLGDHSIGLKNTDPKPFTRLGPEFDVDWEAIDATPPGHLPAWIPLRSGGGIFVIIDNILVVTPRKDVADKWANRIKVSAARYKATLKETDDHDGVKRTIIRRTLAPGSTSFFEFLGIEWRHKSRRALVRDCDTEAMMAPDWTGTYRDLAVILGKLLWHYRVMQVLGWRDVSTAVGQDVDALLKLFRKAAPPQDQCWSSTCSTLSPTDILLLSRLWRQRLQDYRQGLGWTTASPPRAVTSVGWGLSDASGINAATGLGGLGFMLFRRLTTVAVQLEVIMQSITKSAHNIPDIALAEFKALIDMVRALIKAQPDVNLIIAGVDSMNVKNWIEKTYARNEQAMTYLAELRRLLDGRRIFIVYLPSELNAADVPSRQATASGADWDLRVAGSTRILAAATLAAAGEWVRSESHSGGAAVRKRVDYLCEESE